VASLSQGRTAAAQCGLFTHKSVPVIFEPPCILLLASTVLQQRDMNSLCVVPLPPRTVAQVPWTRLFPNESWYEYNPA